MSELDKNFDDRVRTFKKNIYGTSKGRIREAVLLRDLDGFMAGKGPLSILDIGGGQGQIALKLAAMGHKVTISDISNEMLEIAKTTATETGLVDVQFIHSSLQSLDSRVGEKFDLVMCHAVFEWLDKPDEALSILKQFCQPCGAISLMFYNHTGQTLSNLVYGNFDYIRSGMKAKNVVKLNPQSSLKPEDVLLWCEALDLNVRVKSGVRCFHDYMRDISHWQTQFDSILEMELEYSRLEPYASIGRYMHLILDAGEN